MRPSPEADPTPILVTRLMEDVDPILLDFIKINTNSFIKWDLLKLFHENRHTIDTAENIAQDVGRTAALTERELDDLVDSGLMAKSGQEGKFVYSLRSDEATWALMHEFISACDSRDFRIKVVYQIIRADSASL